MTDKAQEPVESKSSLSEAEKFLESLNLPDSQTQETDGAAITETDSKDIMSFLDEISNYPTEDTTESKPEQAKQSPKVEQKKPEVTPQPASQPASQPAPQPANDGGWKSWGNSFWNQASAAVKNTTDQINRSVSSDSASKLLESRVKTLQNFVNKENIEKLSTGLKNLTTTILETVAPPISEHELVEVWLSYDMHGYPGVEGLVYRAFARVLENTESGDVVIHTLEFENEPMDKNEPDLCLRESLVDGIKLGKASIDRAIKKHYKPEEKKEMYTPQSGAVPVIHCPVFMSIQAVKCTMEPIDEEDTELQQVVFVIVMVDPTNKLKFKTYSQSTPLKWLDVPRADNDWVEELMAENIMAAVTSIAQDYVWTRMSGNQQTKEGQVQEV